MVTARHRIKFGEREVYFYRRKDCGQLVFGYKVGNRWRETRCPLHIRAQRDAEEFARAYLEEFERTGGKPEVMPSDPTQARKELTVAEVAERWLELRKDKEELAQATKDQGKSNIYTHIAPKLRNPKAADPILGDLRVQRTRLRNAAPMGEKSKDYSRAQNREQYCHHAERHVRRCHGRGVDCN